MRTFARVVSRLAIAALTLIVALALAGTAAANPPTALEFVEVFEDVDPCTGLVHEVTIKIDVSVHDHEGSIVAHGHRTITTSSGYTGHGSFSIVENSRVFRVTNTDILTNESGNMIRAHAVVVFDLESGAVRVESVGLTCVRA